jgi:hypothetical protein
LSPLNEPSSRMRIGGLFWYARLWALSRPTYNGREPTRLSGISSRLTTATLMPRNCASIRASLIGPSWCTRRRSAASFSRCRHS